MSNIFNKASSYKKGIKSVKSELALQEYECQQENGCNIPSSCRHSCCFPLPIKMTKAQCQKCVEHYCTGHPPPTRPHCKADPSRNWVQQCKDLTIKYQTDYKKMKLNCNKYYEPYRGGQLCKYKNYGVPQCTNAGGSCGSPTPRPPLTPPTTPAPTKPTPGQIKDSACKKIGESFGPNFSAAQCIAMAKQKCKESKYVQVPHGPAPGSPNPECHCCKGDIKDDPSASYDIYQIKT